MSSSSTLIIGRVFQVIKRLTCLAEMEQTVVQNIFGMFILFL